MHKVSSEPFRILFVDDEVQAVKYFEKAFGRRFSVQTATNADEAVAILESRDDFAVVVTDQRMPGRTGVSLLSYLRERRPEIIRILTTAYADLDSAIAGVNSGEIFRYITKPWNLKALEAELAHALDFFTIRRERNQLLNEKLAVVHKTVLRDRVFSLAAASSALPSVDNAAVSSVTFMLDCLKSDGLAPAMARSWAAFPSRDYWQLPIMECRRAQATLAGMAALRCPALVAPTTVDLVKLFAASYEGGPIPNVVAQHSRSWPAVLVPHEALSEITNFMIARLASWRTGDASIHIAAVVDGDEFGIAAEASSVDLAAALSESPILSLPKHTVEPGIVEMMRMVLMAGHYGGRLSSTPTTAGGWRFRISLPTATVQVPRPMSEQRLEDLLDAYDRFIAPTYS